MANPTHPSDRNMQHGAPIGDGMCDGPTHSEGRVATGDRREEVHFVQREGGDLRAEHLKKPAGPLPPQMAAAEGWSAPEGPPVEDVAVAPEGPSVWDARPANERPESGDDEPGP